MGLTGRQFDLSPRSEEKRLFSRSISYHSIILTYFGTGALTRLNPISLRLIPSEDQWISSEGRHGVVTYMRKKTEICLISSHRSFLYMDYFRWNSKSYTKRTQNVVQENFSKFKLRLYTLFSWNSIFTLAHHVLFSFTIYFSHYSTF